MLPYQFNEIYFRVTGEYENDIQILFFYADSSDVMVHTDGCLLDSIDSTELSEIETLLGKVLDPNGKVFTKYELIKNYNFPDVDLDTIDIDNY